MKVIQLSLKSDLFVDIQNMSLFQHDTGVKFDAKFKVKVELPRRH